MFSHISKLELTELQSELSGGWGICHLTINFSLYVEHLNSVFGLVLLGVGNLTTKFQKVEMSRGMPGEGMLIVLN